MMTIFRALRTWWDCPHCGNTNRPSDKVCNRCGR